MLVVRSERSPAAVARAVAICVPAQKDLRLGQENLIEEYECGGSWESGN